MRSERRIKRTPLTKEDETESVFFTTGNMMEMAYYTEKLRSLKLISKLLLAEFTLSHQSVMREVTIQSSGVDATEGAARPSPEKRSWRVGWFAVSL